jgi:hypothetical protein
MTIPPQAYYTEGDVNLLLGHKGNLILQDVRVYLKKIEAEEILSEWSQLK